MKTMKTMKTMRTGSQLFLAATAALLTGYGLAAECVGQEKSVKPGINKPFEKPNPEEFVERFEREGREVFDYRQEIVALCRVEPGRVVADVGAGTGLFTRMFAAATGPAGRVFAVDIAADFIDHIQKTCAERGLKNVTGVLCKADSVELSPDSIDVAFICDTYHHFEFPEKTMKSIHSALRPGGQLVLVDFDRIDGVSPAWILDHVRADKQTFVNEVIRAGFRILEEVDLMKESYFLRFQKLRDDEEPPPNTPLPVNPLRGKRVIEWGWDEPDTKFMRENVERMEKLPFDGVVFHANSSSGGNLAWETWGARKFTRAEFDQAVDDLRATPFRRLSDRFLRVNATPGDVDWFDDSGWATVANNFGIAAQVARDGHAKGFMFDVEQYNSLPFDYRAQKDHETKSFADYQRQARERGRQWIQSVNKAFPDITILLTFGYSIAQPKSGGKDRSDVRYGLLSDFLDGVLDGCSDRTTIVDAWESSYPYKTPEQFAKAHDTIRQRSADWSGDPERYRRFVRAGFGIWMDYDWRKAGWDVDDHSKNHFTPEQFTDSVRSALQTSDAYVWVYTEQPRWWTNERLPAAYVEALKKARD
jgi:ubiquinone/menaquinone biosynthesis C-methylase UbiE